MASQYTTPKFAAERACNEKLRKIGYGAFSQVYESVSDPTEIYVLVRSDVPDKEILSHIESAHIPTMQYVAKLEWYGHDYTLWRTRRSERLTKAHAVAWAQYQTIKRAWDEVESDAGSWGMPCYQRVRLCLDRLEDRLDSDLYDALESIYMWATDYDDSICLDICPRNFAVDSDGTLLLRDVFFFQNKLRSGF